MANPVTTVGLGSQLDIKSIVSALVNGDTAAKQSQITTQTQQTTATLSGVSVLKSALASFQSALKTLGDLKNPQFTAFSATSSSASNVTATTDGNAVAGSYSVGVTKIATGASVVTGAFANGTSSAIPSGNLTITQNGIANASALNIQIPAGATLQSVRDQINSQTLATNISANILTDSTGSRLVFSSTVIGVGSDITSTSDVPEFNIGSGAVLDPTSASSAGRIGDPPQNAEFTINGLTMTSSTNTPKGLGVAGLNLTLVAPTISPVTVTVAQNNDGIQKALQSFVDAYNAVVSTVSKQTTPTVDPSTGLATVAAPLTGDAMTRSMMTALSSQLFAGGSSNSGLVALSQLGITVDTAQGSDTNGQLVFDTTATSPFNTAMSTGGLAGQVQQFFAGASVTDTNGLIARLNGVLTPYMQTGGIIDTRNTSLTATQQDLATQQSDLDDKVKSLTDFYNAKYNAMDAVVAQLKATASSVTSFFDSLNGQKS